VDGADGSQGHGGHDGGGRQGLEVGSLAAGRAAWPATPLPPPPQVPAHATAPAGVGSGGARALEAGPEARAPPPSSPPPPPPAAAAAAAGNSSLPPWPDEAGVAGTGALVASAAQSPDSLGDVSALSSSAFSPTALSSPCSTPALPAASWSRAATWSVPAPDLDPGPPHLARLLARSSDDHLEQSSAHTRWPDYSASGSTSASKRKGKGESGRALETDALLEEVSLLRCLSCITMAPPPCAVPARPPVLPASPLGARPPAQATCALDCLLGCRVQGLSVRTARRNADGGAGAGGGLGRQAPPQACHGYQRGAATIQRRPRGAAADAGQGQHEVRDVLPAGGRACRCLPAIAATWHASSMLPAIGLLRRAAGWRGLAPRWLVGEAGGARQPDASCSRCLSLCGAHADDSAPPAATQRSPPSRPHPKRRHGLCRLARTRPVLRGPSTAGSSSPSAPRLRHRPRAPRTAASRRRGGGQAHCLPRHRLPCLLLARPLQRARPAAAATIPRPSSSSPSR